MSEAERGIAPKNWKRIIRLFNFYFPSFVPSPFLPPSIPFSLHSSFIASSLHPTSPPSLPLPLPPFPFLPPSPTYLPSHLPPHPPPSLLPSLSIPSLLPSSWLTTSLPCSHHSFLPPSICNMWKLQSVYNTSQTKPVLCYWRCSIFCSNLCVSYSWWSKTLKCTAHSF